MKRLELACSALIVLLAICSSLFASPATCDDVDRLIDEALTRTGLSKQLGMLSSTMVAAVPDNVFAGRRARRKAERFVVTAVNKDVLTSKIREAIKLDLNNHALGKVLLFYRSRLGSKVGRLQGRALIPSFIREVREGRSIVASLSESRKSILQRIINAQQVSQSSFRLLDQMVNGLADGFLGRGHEESERIRAQLKSLVDRTREADEHMKRLTLAAYARTLGRLNDKELEALAKFHESKDAQWFRQRVQSGLEEAVYICARALGRAISGLEQPSSGTSTREG